MPEGKSRDGDDAVRSAVHRLNLLIGWTLQPALDLEWVAVRVLHLNFDLARAGGLFSLWRPRATALPGGKRTCDHDQPDKVDTP